MLLTELFFYALRKCTAGETTFQNEIGQNSDWNPGSETRQNTFSVLDLLGCSQRKERSADAKQNALSSSVAASGCSMNV